jgi:hypothetical protein
MNNYLTLRRLFFSYVMEGREAVQCTVMDSAFCFIAATLLMCAGGEYILKKLLPICAEVIKDTYTANFSFHALGCY